MVWREEIHVLEIETQNKAADLHAGGNRFAGIVLVLEVRLQFDPFSQRKRRAYGQSGAADFRVSAVVEKLSSNIGREAV